MPFTMSEMVHHLLWRKRRSWQLLLAVLGALIGSVLMFGALQLHTDLHRALMLIRDPVGGDFVVVTGDRNRPQGAFGNLNPDDIEALDSLEVVTGVSPFLPARFKSGSKVDLKLLGRNIRYYTEMFMEAVPDSFLETDPRVWQWNPESTIVPVIIPMSFVTLYNLSFAPSRGLMPVDTQTIRAVPFTIIIENARGTFEFPARVVELTGRLNTILVPWSFLTYANQRFAPNRTGEGYHKLLIQTTTSSDPQFLRTLKDRGLTSLSEHVTYGQIRQLMTITLSILGGLGLFLLLLSLLILFLGFQLLITRSEYDISLLIQLGYAPGRLIRFYATRLTGLFLIVEAVTLTIVIWFHWWTIGLLREFGFSLPFRPGLRLAGALLLLSFVFITLSIKYIRNCIHQTVQPERSGA